MFYEEVKIILDSYGEMKQCSQFLLGQLVDYCISLDELTMQKDILKCMGYISNPTEFIQFVSMFVSKDEEYANYLIK